MPMPVAVAGKEGRMQRGFARLRKTITILIKNQIKMITIEMIAATRKQISSVCLGLSLAQ